VGGHASVAVNSVSVSEEDAAARAEADETRILAEDMEEAGAIEDSEAYDSAKARYAQGLWKEAAELFAVAVGDADI
jgi:F0F1-type ATP synthase epsilon subunit